MSEQMFKAWDNKNKRWINQYEFSIYSDGSIHSHADLDGKTHSFDATLCRSTGLKDKNGVMIFEGDLVKFDDFNPNHCEGDYLPRQIFEVSLKNHRYWLKEERFGHEGELLLSSSDCEIIGNIFEHKHLLEVKQ